jgi:hypothetical protein
MSQYEISSPPRTCMIFFAKAVDVANYVLELFSMPNIYPFVARKVHFPLCKIVVMQVEGLDAGVRSSDAALKKT